jgi:uroporphyrinogen decarboxylase
MTPRERVLLAIDHKKTDRTPANYSAHKEVTDALIAKLAVADYEGLLQALHVDMRRIHFNYGQPDTGPDRDGYLRTMWGARYRKEDPGDGRPMRIAPFDEKSTVDDVHALQWPDPAALDYSGIKPQCDKVFGHYATFGAPWSPFFHEVGWLIGQQNFYVWMTTKPDVAQALIDHVVDYEVEATRRFLEAADGMVDIAYFGNDFGTQRGLFISPQMWQTFMRQPLKRYFDVSHEFGCKVMKHSCGSVRAIIPCFIEDGVNILDPVQVRAAGMDFAGLLRDFGDQLTFHGAVDTQHMLPFGTTDDVRAQVRSYVELTRERGGYILTGSQDYIKDIPLDNLLAIYDENVKLGRNGARPRRRRKPGMRNA